MARIGSGIVVDAWSGSGEEAHRFVSHAHTDHLPTRATPHLYCSPLTHTFIQLLRPQLKFGQVHYMVAGEVVKLEVNETEVWMVEAVEANHCAGALMFLFTLVSTSTLASSSCTSPRTHLYTGDFRYHPTIHHAPLVPARRCQRLYLDTTFFHARWNFPPVESAIAQIVELINKNHATEGQVYLEIDSLGGERIMEALAKHFYSSIHIVDTKRYALFSCIESLRPHLTQDPTASRFHVTQFKSLSFFLQSSNLTSQCLSALYIRPSAQWFGQPGNGSSAEPKNHINKPCFSNGVWHVLYSNHSSYDEIVSFVQYIQPHSIIPLTECEAGLLQSIFKGILDFNCKIQQSFLATSGDSTNSTSLQLLELGFIPPTMSKNTNNKRTRDKRCIKIQEIDNLDDYFLDTKHSPQSKIQRIEQEEKIIFADENTAIESSDVAAPDCSIQKVDGEQSGSGLVMVKVSEDTLLIVTPATVVPSSSVNNTV